MSKERKFVICVFFLALLVVAAFCVLILTSASAEGADLTISWDAVTGASGYKIQVSDNCTMTQGTVSKIRWGEIRDTRSTATTYTWTGASDTKCSLFRGIAYNDQGEGINYTKGVWYCPSFLPPNSLVGLGLK